MADAKLTIEVVDEGGSGKLATANANQEVARILSDIAEAQKLDKGYSEMIQAQTQFEETVKAGLLPLKEWLMSWMYDQQAKERQKATLKKGSAAPVPQNSAERAMKGDSRAQVGKAVGVSGFTIDCATKVLAEAEPELVKAVDVGRV